MRDKSSLLAVEANWRDRFGSRLPEAVENLLVLTEIRITAGRKGLSHVEVKDLKVMLRRGEDYVLIGTHFPRLQASLAPSRRLKSLLELLLQL